ncbi:hypothetical protein H6G41_30600 [Tolypothrix sp. FACHB-123]|uniref:hypothetical protein n=1 Tax=Tolypothrix sp. FACHB-123 TaxID=2692868 RepID=UPI0016866D66|nr:hypothetical protein [Tolypothrix sp. FACHB-123]MBD2358898.1 hypothetical protein [Tolypothrix sp. FACHB-123]
MTNKKSKNHSFKGMSYRKVQSTNSKKRSKLRREEQAWLKENNYKNIGWHNVINLYSKIEEFFQKYQIEELTLEELFLESDRVGNKYLTSQEITEFNQKLAIEVNDIATIIDQQFPDTEVEFIDFSKTSSKKYRNKKYINL